MTKYVVFIAENAAALAVRASATGLAIYTTIT